MANVKISILTEFLGKGIKDANKSVKTLEGSVKNLGYIFGGGYLGAKVLAFSKAAVMAFAADDKAAQTLTRTLTNLGLAFQDASVAKYITDLELTYGVIDDKLRPAFQKLLTTTGSVAEAQKILKSALDLSAASGVDVVSVTDDLAKAYTGQTRGLAKYGLGLSQAQLKAMSYEQIIARITKLFGGQATLSASTYAGKIEKLNIGADQAKEIFGKGLVDAVEKFGGTGPNKIDNVTKSMKLLAAAGSAVVNTFADVFQAVVNPKGFLTQDLKPPAKNNITPAIQAELAKKVYEDRLKAIREEAALNAKITKDNKAQLALEKQKNALAKASAILNAANKVFDDKAIQLAAAMMGKLTDEEKVRVKLKQDILGLEEAIQENNVTAAASYANAIVQDSQKLQALRGDMQNLNNINNPFNAWLESIKTMAAELAALANIKPIVAPSATMELAKSATYSTTGSETGSYGGFTAVPIGTAQPINVNLNIDGQTIANALVTQSNSGTSSSSARNSGQFSAGYYR